MLKISLIIALVVLCGCDPFWNRSSIVDIGRADYKACVLKALSEIDGVSEVSAHTVDGRYEVSFLTDYGWAFVERVNDGEQVLLKVEVVGRGFSPDNGVDVGVNDMLGKISTKIVKQCES